MSFFIQSLFIVIPIFIILIVLEIIVAKKMKIKINNPVDIISSLSSGITNIAKDGLKFGVLIISYSWLVKHITILKIEPIWLAIIIAFIVQDFSGYWLHRMNHRINIFWNRHIIHHSSEEFNLSCALRQEISTIVRFGAIFMLPAALLGISPTIFAVLGPIHLFMQFWYHTRLINKMGLLETIFVTPSHHRVHHAINTKYMDKNYGQILIIWDKFFGTFQPELKEEKPVYGIIRPANTWNPIIINYKHFWQLLKDAYYTKTWKDKLRIWFMPTGWRPKDVEDLFPIKSTRDSKSQIKYQTNNSRKLILWSFFQLFISGSLMLLMFSIASKISNITLFCLAFFLILNVFSYTSMLDGRKKISIITDLIKLAFILYIILTQDFNSDIFLESYIIIFATYAVISTLATIYFTKSEPQLNIS
ncbi:MAG: sterol desaturase family protein [Candidatus Marinimicrobia bacterium]|nr:sterol desaturase family protein [Candidatus Neomarinimicrobiota bacterium]